MKVIVFSGSSRTGKSTAIATMKNIAEQQSKSVKIFDETAQTYIDTHPGLIEDRYDFIKFIMERESKRLQEIQKLKKNQQYDILLIDRTFLDAFIYMYRGIIHGHITNSDLFSYATEIESSKKLYDIVVFFDTMIVPDENFTDYNNLDINSIFKHTMKSIYGEKLVHYSNNIEFEKNIEKFLKKYI